MDNKPQTTVRSEAKSLPQPLPMEAPDEWRDLLEQTESTNLAERMENWGSD